MIAIPELSPIRGFLLAKRIHIYTKLQLEFIHLAQVLEYEDKYTVLAYWLNCLPTIQFVFVFEFVFLKIGAAHVHVRMKMNANCTVLAYWLFCSPTMPIFWKKRCRCTASLCPNYFFILFGIFCTFNIVVGIFLFVLLRRGNAHAQMQSHLSICFYLQIRLYLYLYLYLNLCLYLICVPAYMYIFVFIVVLVFLDQIGKASEWTDILNKKIRMDLKTKIQKDPQTSPQ